jgi:hypothetical protein
MPRVFLSFLAALIFTSHLPAQSYSKDIRPFLVKYCLECHAGKDAKAGLSLESHKLLMDGADGGPVLTPGKPDASRLVLLIEHKDKPSMPPPKAKFQPTKAEIKLVRAWVAGGAMDDGASVRVELPVIQPKSDILPAVKGLAYVAKEDRLYIARKNLVTIVSLDKKPDNFKITTRELAGEVTVLAKDPLSSMPIVGAQWKFRQFTVSNLEKAGPEITLLPAHRDTILDVTFDHSGRWVASASYDWRIQLGLSRLGAKEEIKQHTLEEHSDAVYGLAFNPDGTLLASVSADRAMKVWDVEKGTLLYTLGEATDWLYTVAWSPDGKYLVSGGVDKSIRVYEPTETGAKLRQSVFAHQGPVQKVLFSSDSKTLYSVGQDRVIKAWDVEKMVERKVYDKQPETVLCMALREDAGQIIIGRYDGIVQLIDMKTGKVAHEFGKPAEKEKGRQGEGEKGNKQSVAPGGSPASAPMIALPGKIDGTLDRAGAVHFYRLEAKAGQQLGVKLETKELKSKIDPVLVIADMSGKLLAESYEGHLGHKFDKAGTIAIGVRDRDYRGGADFKYKLYLGEIPVVRSIFPLGVARGSEADLFVEGVFLDTDRVRIKVPKDAQVGSKVAVPVKSKHGAPLGRLEVIVGEFPNVLPDMLHLREPPKSIGTIPVPATANGRLRRDGDADVWAFKARKGQPLVLEVKARRIGSRLDSVIEILDKDLKPVPRAVLRSQAKTAVTFRDHDSAQGNIRIEAWSELGVNDYLFVGNELMKIQALPTHPDADCNFFATAGQRIGYLDTTPTHHASGAPMYKVTLHPPGTTFPPNGFPTFTLNYKNDDGGPGYGRDSRILFDPPADGQYHVRITDARGMGGVECGYRVTVRPAIPHFALKVSPQKPVVSKGGAIPITFTAERIDGFDGPITIKPIALAGFHMPSTTIEAGTYTTTAALYADADATLPKRIKTLIFEGSTHATGLPFASVAMIDMPTLIEPGDIVTTVKESEVAIKPGGQASMTVTIERRNGFKGRVPLDVKGLPHGVRVLDIGLNGILVNENETTRTVAIYAEPWVAVQDHPFVVLARREGKNTEHAAKSVMLKVK